MAQLLSGSVWIVLINRKGRFGPARDQWVKYLVYLLIVNLIWWGLVLFDSGAIWIGLVLVLGTLVEWARIFRRERIMRWHSLLFSLILVGFLGSLTLEKNLILHTYFVVVIFDGTGQVFGQIFGKRPLVPRISPRKTVEGLAGASVITMAAALLTSKALSIQWTQMLWTTPLIMGAALTGDLLASAMKRKMKKDTFSHVIPGHGGVLDRFDSWLAAGAAGFLIFSLTG
ncbi:MAG: phosphatidate cytidylyltransferase [Bacteroidales bacterium]